MGDLSFVTDGMAKVTIEHRVRSINYQFKINGLWLVVEWAQCRLVVEVSENDRDSDYTYIYFYSNIELDNPDAAFALGDQNFNTEAFRLITRVAMHVSQGRIDVADLKESSFFDGTNVKTINPETYIPKLKPQQKNCHDLL